MLHGLNLALFLKNFLNAYPLLIPGFHRINFLEDNVCLTLIFGDVRDTISQLQAKVDAWYFDGFAPAKNPELWTGEVFKQAIRCSNDDATCSTFSSAKKVQENLSSAGFSIEKIPGYGRKREMLKGLYQPSMTTPNIYSPKKRAIIIGAGIAGASIAQSLAERSFEVSVFEREKEVASKASGNMAGMLMPYLSNKPDSVSAFYFSAYTYVLRDIERLKEAGHVIKGQQAGLIRLITSKRLSKLYENLTSFDFPEDFVNKLSAKEVEKVSGIQTINNALYFPKGWWVSPPDYVKAKLNSIAHQTEIHTNQENI